MPESNFIDEIKILCRSGKGGAGAVHFHSDRFTRRGGPDGGDGGRGGDILLRGNQQLWTLLHLKYKKHILAGDGGNGRSALKKGADGNDELVEIPLGTIARDADTGKQIMEITRHDETAILLPGGRGGKGNDFFKSSTHQTPRFAQPGEPGQEKWITLELKVLADVGLVGFPNAGKSTLLSVLSAAKPKIADYPFTTLVPNLGIVAYRDHRSFVMADMPGIIEGAHAGKGLGLRFLRHIERNAVLLFMIPVDCNDIRKHYQVLHNELKQYNPALLIKKRLLAITKCDLADEKKINNVKTKIKDIPHVCISSITGKGIDGLKDNLWRLISASL